LFSRSFRWSAAQRQLNALERPYPFRFGGIALFGEDSGKYRQVCLFRDEHLVPLWRPPEPVNENVVRRDESPRYLAVVIVECVGVFQAETPIRISVAPARRCELRESLELVPVPDRVE